MHTPKKLPGLRICAHGLDLDGDSGPSAPSWGFRIAGLGGLPDAIQPVSGARDPNFPEGAGPVLH